MHGCLLINPRQKPLRNIPGFLFLLQIIQPDRKLIAAVAADNIMTADTFA